MTRAIPRRASDAAPAAVTAAAILIYGGLIRRLLEADLSHVYLLGRPLEWACALRSHFGLPCPTCGLTRSVVLALHGRFVLAWSMAPGGAAAVAGGCALAVGLLMLASFRALGCSSAEVFGSRVRQGAVACAAIVLIVWMGGWAAEFATALHSR